MKLSKLKSGVHPKIVSERPGHASVAFTLGTYSHVVPGIQEAADERFDKMLEPASEPAGTRTLNLLIKNHKPDGPRHSGECHSLRLSLRRRLSSRSYDWCQLISFRVSAMS